MTTTQATNGSTDSLARRLESSLSAKDSIIETCSLLSAGIDSAFVADCCKCDQRADLYQCFPTAHDTNFAPVETCAAIRNKLLPRLKSTYLRGSSYNSRLQDALCRLGMALHFVLLRDQLAERSTASESWTDVVRPAWQAWNGSVAPMPEIEAFWLWQNVAGTTSDFALVGYSVMTNVVVVERSGSQEGSIGRLSLRLLTTGSPDSLTGFVRTPRSFQYLLDKEFESSFANTYRYFTTDTGGGGLDIWPGGIAVEWDIAFNVSNEFDASPLLAGASAGGAIAIATGSLLARYYLDQRDGRKK